MLTGTVTGPTVFNQPFLVTLTKTDPTANPQSLTGVNFRMNRYTSGLISSDTNCTVNVAKSGADWLANVTNDQGENGGVWLPLGTANVVGTGTCQISLFQSTAVTTANSLTVSLRFILGYGSGAGWAGNYVYLQTLDLAALDQFFLSYN